MDLDLADATTTYDLSIPQSYQEARVRLQNSGAILDQAIDDQSSQVRTAQMLTAQTMRDLGRGWEAIFAWATDDPANPAPDEMRFRWQPEGQLYFEFPLEISEQFCQQGVRNLLRAGEWQQAMRESNSYESLGEISGRFAFNFEEKLAEEQLDEFEANIELAAIRIFDWIFSTEENNRSIFTSLQIDWGEDISGCLQEIYQARIASR